MAVGARIAVPLPPSPVPLTLQVPFVLLAGVLLGSRRAVASVAAYLAAGILWVPVFAAGGGIAYLLGPTGGYLLGFLPAAFTAAGTKLALGQSGGPAVTVLPAPS